MRTLNFLCGRARQRRWAAVAGALLLAAATPAWTADAAPDRAALEKQLADARSRLEDAATDVARLSHQLYGGDERDVMREMHGMMRGGAMLGVAIGGGAPRDEGVAVASVSPGGPAEAAGLRAGDVIVAVDGKSLARLADQTPERQLVDYMRSVKPGQAVKVDYLRNGKKQSVTVAAAAAEPPMIRMMHEAHMMPPDGPMPPDAPMAPFMSHWTGPGRALGGLELVEVTPRLGRYFGTDKGLLVVRAPEQGSLGLQEGDVVLSIGGRVPENPGHAFRILRSYQPSEKFKIEVQRERKRLTLDASVPEDAGPGAWGGKAMGPPPVAPAPRPAAPAAPAPLPRNGAG